METRILLGGGGSADEELPVLEKFTSWIGQDGSVLYLPIAMPRAGQAQFDWIRAALRPLETSQIEMWTDLHQRRPAELTDFAGIFIGGGNTYHLLHQLQTDGFMEALREFAAGRGMLYGGSAGAIVFGHDIETCAHMDENIAGITNTAGLNLVHGHAIWCHYTPDDDPLIHAYMARTQTPTIALSETSGFWVRAPGDFIQLGSPPVLFEP
jgi:dipeptidase E